MLTFVLVLFLTGNGVTQIAGYASQDECEAAGRVAFKNVGAGSDLGRPLVVTYTCVPGPRRN